MAGGRGRRRRRSRVGLDALAQQVGELGSAQGKLVHEIGGGGEPAAAVVVRRRRNRVARRRRGRVRRRRQGRVAGSRCGGLDRDVRPPRRRARRALPAHPVWAVVDAASTRGRRRWTRVRAHGNVVGGRRVQHVDAGDGGGGDGEGGSAHEPAHEQQDDVVLVGLGGEDPGHLAAVARALPVRECVAQTAPLERAYVRRVVARGEVELEFARPTAALVALEDAATARGLLEPEARRATLARMHAERSRARSDDVACCAADDVDDDAEGGDRRQKDGKEEGAGDGAAGRGRDDQRDGQNCNSRGRRASKK